ncbi:hypothetical protein N7478_003894 [Penicillium angulare]|uniref:uncharacterized protein n=1 Tax=Penicillium angulare TaxID=116970 RepID=UPI002541A7BF|nr:uncharacterized protein N7478_003894 [Penicillium angulare]KAJ5288208.1 hypothetical protein N7478_003894 [Penicillium angulare]
MGQRHNRRRTRPHSSHRTNTNQDTSFSASPILSHSSIWNSPSSLIDCPSPSIRHSTICISRGSPAPVPAPTWQYGYTAWKIRETPSRREIGGVEAEQYRLFGGEPGDDVNLCHRMLEYFDGLDYIDS